MNQRIFRAALGVFSNLVILTLMSSLAFASDKDVVKSLKDEFIGKIVILRGMYSTTYVHFDSNAHVLNNARTGYWASDALLEVKKVRIKSGRLEISGDRVITIFDSKSGRFQNHRTHSNVAFAIDLDPNWPDAATGLHAALSKVLAPSIEDLAKTLPSYWRCWLSGSIEQTGKGEWRCTPGGVPDDAFSDLPAAQKSPELRKTDAGTEYYECVKGINPPKPLKAEDPSFPSLASSEKIQGTTVLWVIVNERGVPAEIRIRTPKGAGLDDQAVEAVRQWQFAPAMKDGHPVPVAVNVQVNFRFY